MSETAFREGMDIRCPECRRDSVVKRSRKMDGWTYVGDVYACAFCGAELAPVDSGVPADGGAVADARRLKALAALLDSDSSVLDRPALVRDEDARFCRDCRHFLKHPFISRCLLHERSVEPMDDCEDFVRRPDEAPSTEPPENSP